MVIIIKTQKVKVTSSHRCLATKMLHDDHVDLKLCENFLGATVRGGISRSFGHIPEAEPGLRVTGPRVIWSTILVNYF